MRFLHMKETTQGKCLRNVSSLIVLPLLLEPGWYFYYGKPLYWYSYSQSSRYVTGETDSTASFASRLRRIDGP